MISAIFLLLLSFPQGEAMAEPRVSDLLRLARDSKSPSDRAKRYSDITADSIRDENDVRVVYEELEVLGQEASRTLDRAKLQDARHLAAVLGKTTDGRHRAVMAELLLREAAGLPKNYGGPWGAKNSKEEIREAIRVERLKALTDAAGGGRSDAALPALRKLRERGGISAQAAEVAIGKIGKPEDLKKFLSEIKGDPKVRIDLSGFGAGVFEEIMRDFNDPLVPAEQKERLLGYLPRARNKAEVAKYLELLKSPNRRVAAIAARNISRSLDVDDEGLVRELLDDKEGEVRASAIGALGRLLAKDKRRYAPLVVNVLKNDPSPSNRSIAARYLGTNKIQEAEADLRKAAAEDLVPSVRESARDALKWLDGSMERQLRGI